MTDIGTIEWAGTVGGHPQTGEFRIQQYPSGEPLIAHHAVSNLRVERIRLLRTFSMLDFMTGLFFVDAMRERGHDVPELILPFVPGARQDRLNPVGDFLFTAKSVAKEINARGFPKVTVLDPHSEVISALIDRCHVVHASECIDVATFHLAYDAVVAPDAGSEKRAGAVAKKLGLPVIHGWKTRNVANGEITGFGLERTDGLTRGELARPLPRVLVVDDICDGGGTFLGLGAVIQERELLADLYVTHGLFTQGTAKLLTRYGKLYTTDSLEPHGPEVHVFPVCKQLLERT